MSASDFFKNEENPVLKNFVHLSDNIWIHEPSDYRFTLVDHMFIGLVELGPCAYYELEDRLPFPFIVAPSEYAYEIINITNTYTIEWLADDCSILWDGGTPYILSSSGTDLIRYCEGIVRPCYDTRIF